MTGHVSPTRSVGTSSARRALTLVELLVTMAIVSILAATVVFAMASATESAKKAKTRTMITKLHALLMERWESYETRRVPINTTGLDPKTSSGSGYNRQQRQGRQLDALRELMMIELPDRWLEVTRAPSWINRTGLSQGYRSRYRSFFPRGDHNSTYQGAECLYLIITMATGDGDALEQFSDNDVGDVDQDKAPEFHDGWGHPINFLGWPVGFASEVQAVKRDASGNLIIDSNDHDPFDPFHLDPEAYRIVPLIYSAGPDQEYGIINNNVSGNFEYPRPQGARPPPPQALSPYVVVNTADNLRMGDIDPTNPAAATDNMHNHLIGAN
ncbi:MAG: type II secretion system protein [Pirellulales bacterium]